MLTRHDLIEVAQVLAGDYAVNVHDPEKQRVVRNITYSLADVFARDNPRFDRENFYRAVGMVE